MEIFAWLSARVLSAINNMKNYNWNSISLAPEGIVVMTKIDDADGERNVQKLKKQKRLWFTEDGEMYVYYTPTHFAYLP